ncbi:MAG TPA: hypothetical protein VGB69_12235 [Edaphobacter sp.]
MAQAMTLGGEPEQPDATRKRQAVEHLLKSRFFHKSPLLSAFLLYVSRRAIEEPTARIPEHEIGVHVFGRSEDFDTRDDNIVRNYARQLRRRLQEYYATDGAGDAVRIDIPRGGYVPLFAMVDVATASPIAWRGEEDKGNTPVTITGDSSRGHVRYGLFLLLLCLYSIGLYRFAQWQPDSHSRKEEAANPLWSQMFNLNRDTYIVPSDTGFVVMQEANHRTFSLTEYLQWHSSASEKSLAMSYLRSESYTNLLSIFITNELKNLKGVVPSRFIVRGAHDMRFEDFRDSNAILIGSNFSNPWTELFSKNTNFQFHNDLQAGRYWIENIHPLSGESTLYRSGEQEHSYVTYATIVYLPNLSGTGHVLLLQGLDSAGTQAAADFMIRNDGGKRILDQMMASNKGSLKSFELLLEAVSLDAGSHTTGLRVIASRQYS